MRILIIILILFTGQLSAQDWVTFDKDTVRGIADKLDSLILASGYVEYRGGDTLRGNDRITRYFVETIINDSTDAIKITNYYLEPEDYLKYISANKYSKPKKISEIIKIE